MSMRLIILFDDSSLSSVYTTCTLC